MSKRAGFVLLCTWLMSAIGGGQNLVWKDTVVLVAIQNPADTAISPVRFSITQDLEYSFTCANMFFLNWQQDNGKNQVSLLQNIKYQSQFNNTRNFFINTTFVHDLGVQFFFDSISRFQ